MLYTIIKNSLWVSFKIVEKFIRWTTDDENFLSDFFWFLYLSLQICETLDIFDILSKFPNFNQSDPKETFSKLALIWWYESLKIDSLTNFEKENYLMKERIKPVENETIYVVGFIVLGILIYENV